MNWVVYTVVGVFVLGIGHILFDIFQTKRKKKIVLEYLDTLNKLIKFADRGKDTSKEVFYILRNSEDISEYLDETEYDMPVLDLSVALKNQNYYNLKDIVHRIFSNFPEFEKNNQREIQRCIRYLLNPFIWFYKGVETISFFIFGYFIHLGTIKVPSTGWNIFNTIFSLLAGAASIIGLFIQLFEK